MGRNAQGLEQVPAPSLRPEELARRFFAAVEVGDLDGLVKMLARFWGRRHSTTASSVCEPLDPKSADI
jgi:hypothetical protein